MYISSLIALVLALGFILAVDCLKSDSNSQGGSNSVIFSPFGNLSSILERMIKPTKKKATNIASNQRSRFKKKSSKSKKSKKRIRIQRRTFDAPSKEESLVTYFKKIDNCTEVKKSGIYQMKIPGFKSYVQVRCEASFLQGGWIVLQQRENGDIDFYRPWLDYKNGFGIMHTEFWYGLEKVSRLTNNNRYELLCVLENKDGNRGYAKYDHFIVGPESDGFKLEKLGAYKGEIGDNMQYHLGAKFSTYDKQNSKASNENCAISYRGAWWFKDCYQCHLNGRYPTEYDTNCDDCIAWNGWYKEVPIKVALMLMRINTSPGWED